MKREHWRWFRVCLCLFMHNTFSRKLSQSRCVLFSRNNTNVCVCVCLASSHPGSEVDKFLAPKLTLRRTARGICERECVQPRVRVCVCVCDHQPAMLLSVAPKISMWACRKLLKLPARWHAVNHTHTELWKEHARLLLVAKRMQPCDKVERECCTDQTSSW